MFKLNFCLSVVNFKAKQKYRGMFKTQKSGNKTSSGEIGLNIRRLLTFATTFEP